MALAAHTDNTYFVRSVTILILFLSSLACFPYRPIPAACRFSTYSSTPAAQVEPPSSSTASTSPPSSAISTQMRTSSSPQSRSPPTPQVNPGSSIVPPTHHSSTTPPETCVQCDGTTTTEARSVTCRTPTSRVCTKRCVRGTNSSRPKTRSTGFSSLRERSSVRFFLPFFPYTPHLRWLPSSTVEF
jgi:hypothetical protein